MSPRRDIPIGSNAGQLTIIDDIVLVTDRTGNIARFHIDDLLPLAQAAMLGAHKDEPGKGNSREHAQITRDHDVDVHVVIDVLRRSVSSPP